MRKQEKSNWIKFCAITKSKYSNTAPILTITGTAAYKHANFKLYNKKLRWKANNLAMKVNENIKYNKSLNKLSTNCSF